MDRRSERASRDEAHATSMHRAFHQHCLLSLFLFIYLLTYFLGEATLV